MRTPPITIPASDGKPLTLYAWLPEQAPRGIVHFSHGMSEHGQRYADIAHFLNQAGFAVYAHDHRGHGATASSPVELGHYADEDGWNKVVSDIGTINAYIRNAHPGLPVFLFGHSMGSFIVRAYLLRAANTVQGAVISATGFEQSPIARLLRSIAALVGRRKGFAVPSRFMSKLVFGTFNLQFLPAKTPFDWLSRDPETPRKYIADPLCGFDCSPQLWVDLFGGIIAMEAAEKQAGCLPASLPVWLLAGTRDAVSMGGKGIKQLAKRYQKAGVESVSVTLYPGGRHEMLNERNRDEVYADLLGWLNQQLA